MTQLRAVDETDVRLDGFRPELLTLARMSRGMTQDELARATGISQPTISRLEQQFVPSEEQLQGLASALGYPRSFFFQDDPVYGFGVGELFHRRHKTMSTKTLNAVHAEMNIGMMVTRRLLKAIDANPVDLPVVDSDGTPVGAVEAARALRARWLVPRGPVRSVSDLLERSGILTIPLKMEVAEVDAIGVWPVQMPPLIFVNTRVTQDRLRLTLMHEVAHFVLHSGWGLNFGPEIEIEANRFSSEFLAPSAELLPQLHRLTLEKLADLKRHWGISMGALLMRAKELDAISPRRYQALWTEMGKLGYRKREPVALDVVGEDPGRSFREILRLHSEVLQYSAEELAAMTNLDEKEFAEKYLGAYSGPQPVRGKDLRQKIVRIR